MSMIGEVAASIWEEAKSLAVSIVRTLACVAAWYLILRWCGVPHSATRMGIAMVLLVVGSVMICMGRHMTGSGFYASFHGSRTWVDTATPLGAWRFGGALCWVAGVACAVLIE